MQPWVSGSFMPRKVQDLINITDGLWQPASRSSMMCVAPPSTNQQSAPSSNTRQKSENLEHILLELLEKFDVHVLPSSLGDQGPAQSALCSSVPAAAAPATAEVSCPAPAPPPAPQRKALCSWGPQLAAPAAAEVSCPAPAPPQGKAPSAASPAAPEAPRHVPAPAWAPPASKPETSPYSWPRPSGFGPAAADWLVSVPRATCQDPFKERQTALAHNFLKDFAQAARRCPAKHVKDQNPYGKNNSATEAFLKAAAAIQLQHCRSEENELQSCHGEENEFPLNGYDYGPKMWTASTPRFTPGCSF